MYVHSSTALLSLILASTLFIISTPQVRGRVTTHMILSKPAVYEFYIPRCNLSRAYQRKEFPKQTTDKFLVADLDACLHSWNSTLQSSSLSYGG